MKTLFVRNTSPIRRERTHKHFTERGIYDEYNVVWVDSYPKDHPMVLWLKETFCKHQSVEEISGYLKYIEIFKQCKDWITVTDDDVLIPKNWKERIASVQLKPINYISMGVNYHLDPTVGYTITNNIGGCETMIISKDFCELFLNNIDFKQCIDIVMGAMTMAIGLPLAVTPIFQQTSIIERKTTYNHSSTKYDIDWITYTRTYKPSGLSWARIEDEYNVFYNKKKKLELFIKEYYGTDVDIMDIAYVHSAPIR